MVRWFVGVVRGWRARRALDKLSNYSSDARRIDTPEVAATLRVTFVKDVIHNLEIVNYAQGKALRRRLALPDGRITRDAVFAPMGQLDSESAAWTRVALARERLSELFKAGLI